MFATCPLPSANANPEEAVKVFFEVCQQFDTEDIELAASQFMSGTVAGYNPAFAPTAPQFATQVRNIRGYAQQLRNVNIQAQAQLYERAALALPNPDRTPESMARVKDMAKAMDYETAAKEDPELKAKALEILRRQDELFEDNFVESKSGIKVSKYLVKLLNIDVGDHDGRDD